MNLSSLFTVERDIVELNKEAKNIEYLRKIYERDHGIVTKVNGVDVRIKHDARKEIAYIYFTVNKEYFDQYDKKQRPNIIRKKIGLDSDWKADELIINAIKELTIDVEGIEDKLIKSFDDTFHKLSTLLKSVNASSDYIIEQLSDSKINTIDKFDEQRKLIEAATGNIKLALEASTQLKTAIKNVEELKADRSKKVRNTQKQNRLETDSSIYKRKEDDV